ESPSADWPLWRDPGYAIGVITEQHRRRAVDRTRIASRSGRAGQSGDIVEIRVQLADEVEAEIGAGEGFRADRHPPRGQLHLSADAPAIAGEFNTACECGIRLECGWHILRAHHHSAVAFHKADDELRRCDALRGIQLPLCDHAALQLRSA